MKTKDPFAVGRFADDVGADIVGEDADGADVAGVVLSNVPVAVFLVYRMQEVLCLYYQLSHS